MVRSFSSLTSGWNDLMLRTITAAMPVGDIVTRKPVCVERETTILAVSKLMRGHQVGELVVTDRAKGLLVPAGIVSARDIVTRILATGLDPSVLTAGDIIWSESTGARVTDSVSETLQLLQATRRTSLPVVDGDGCLAGVVSLDDLVWALAEKAGLGSD
jgi:CBS domain-containing protein